MADEPENLMLSLLREIRSKLDEHDRRFDAHDKRFDELGKQIADWQETTATGLGFAAHANLRTQAIEQEISDLRRRIEKLEETH